MFLQSKLYDSHDVCLGEAVSTALERTIQSFKFIFSIIKSYHLNKKTILFVGLESNLAFFINRCTFHNAISSDANFQYFLNDKGSLKKNFNSSYAYFDTSSILHSSLVVVFNEKKGFPSQLLVFLKSRKIPCIYVGVASDFLPEPFFIHKLIFKSQKEKFCLSFLNNLCFMFLKKIFRLKSIKRPRRFALKGTNKKPLESFRKKSSTIKKHKNK